MSLSEEWKKRKENSLSEQWKRQKQKENEELIKNPESKISSYDSLKKSTLKEIGTQIKNDNEERKQQEDNSTNQKLLLPLLNQGQTINVNSDNVINDLSNMNYGKRASIINAITNNEKDANKLKVDTMQYQQEKETKEKANKINKDISNGNYSSAIAHVLLGVPQKALDSTSTTFASMNSIVAPKKISNTQADENELLKTNKLLSKKYEQTTSNIDNDIVKTASEVSGTIGGMVPSIISNIALPGSGVVTQGINVGAQEYQDTLNEDASNKVQATITGAAKGIVSGLIEKISGGNIIGKGSLDDSAAKFIESHFKGKVGQKLASKAYEMIGEIGEENLENQLGYVIDKIVNNKELPNFQEWWSEAKETTKGTFLTTLVLNALGLGGSTYNDIQDIKGQKYLNEAKNIIRNELNNNTNININEKTNLLNNLNNVNTLQDYNNYLKNNKDLQQNQVNKENNIQTQQIIQEQNKMSQNQTLEQINNNLANNQETLYNNNESESGINGEQRRSTNGIQTSNLGGQEENAFSVDRYKQEETKIRSQGEVKYTDNDKNFATKMQNKYNKKIFIYDDTNTSYGGGISYIDNNTIMFGRNALDNYGYDFLEGHEVLEDINKNYKDIAKNTLDNLKQKLQDDTGFGDVFLKYIADMKDDVYQYYINKPELIAKEIIGDLNGLRNANIDYSTLENYKALNPELVKEIQNEVLNLENIIYSNKGNENSNESSFSFPKVKEKSQKINFPTAEYIERMENKKQSENSKIPGREDINLPKTKQELLENNSKALNKYIQERNSTIRKIEAQINQKQQELNSKENKDSIIANKLKTQIIELSKKKKDIELMYNKKIDDTFNKGEKIIQSQDMSGRKAVIEKNRVLAREKISNIATWKDKNNGFKYQRETMERNMFDIIPNKQEAQDIVDTYFEPIHKSEAEKQKFINKYNDKIKELNLNKYESEAVQLLGEQKYNPDFKADDVKEILDRVNENIENGKVDKAKVDKAIEVFRSTYDELFELENKALKENGYPEKPYRKGYFPHFIDSEPITKTEKILDKLGFKIDKRPLPTDIAGITEQFVPGKTWNRSSLNRKTDKTTYNALKGFDTYISQATDNIFHTENIQKLRALENEIRYQYSDKGIQERIDEIYNNDILNQEEQQAAIEKIFEQVDNPMSNLVVELRRYTNALANKKSEADRSAEQKYGRQLYSTVNAIESRFGANAVGLNIGSAITNFIPITQAYSQVSTKNMGRATLDTIKSYIQDDGFVDKSTFLTNRINKSEKLYKTSLEKISDKTSFLFNAIDDVTSNIIVRGKYLENINNGMSEAEAIKNADRFAANVMADRSKGALPTLFEEKSPITKMFTQFQLEVNNQYSYMFKDIPRDLKEKGLANIALAFFKMFIAAWAYNKASEEITGRKPAFSPIDIAVSTYNTMGDSNTKTADKLINVGKDIVEEVPFVGSFFGGGRIPISGALPDAENSFKAVTGLITGEMDSNKAMNTLRKEVSKPLYYLLPPFGGAQAKKTIEGIGTVANGGSYGIDSKGEETLQFPVENANLKDYLKAALFGKYSLDNAKEYSNRNYKSLNAKQTKIYKEASIPYKELLEYIDKGLKKKEEKIAYLETQDLNEQQKWGIYKYDILSNTERDDGGSQLSDAEYMISNGLSKNEFINIYNKAQNNNIDIPTETEYKKMKKSGINLNNYIDYKIEVKNQTQVKRDRGELTQKQDLKNKDKIQILLDSKYSDKEITSIYENYIKNAKDTQYDIISKSGINIKEYLKYKQQEFESDKKEDGTTTGKTISGSKKKKEYSYVNSMNITYEQKLLLLGMNYTLTNKEQTKLANYVNNMKLTKQEKLDIYEKLSGFKVYKNGRVTW